MQSLSELNQLVAAQISVVKERPAQLMDQMEFNKRMLFKLNELAIIYSKGKRTFQITQENEWLLKVVFAYLNRNADDKELTYKITIKNETITKTLSLEKGILLLGNFGVGKTLLFRAIHAEMQFLKLTGRFVTSRQIYECKKEDYDSVTGKDKYGLFIDDLGDEPLKSVEYGNEDTPVARILKQRMDNFEQLEESPKLFISSNCSPAKLTEYYGGRIVSRIHGSMNVIITPQQQDFRKL